MNASGLKEQQQRNPDAVRFHRGAGPARWQHATALLSYGIKENAWANEEQMFALVHQMRTRIMTSPAFNGDRILGAILFEGHHGLSMEREACRALSLKVDRGLAERRTACT